MFWCLKRALQERERESGVKIDEVIFSPPFSSEIVDNKKTTFRTDGRKSLNYNVTEYSNGNIALMR